MTHGLEGDSSRPYILSAARYFSTQGWDALAWNCRSCSGEMNKQLRLYNHGEIGDIGLVIDHALRTKKYEQILLLGYSMGGNISMKYVGVNGKHIPDQLKAVIAVSAPADMQESVRILEHPSNKIYDKKFITSLTKKIKQKAIDHPEYVDFHDFKRVKSWEDFINIFNAPINGYRDATDFYQQASAANFVGGTTIPTLLLNALNDPILTPKCSPTELAKKHPLFYLENPKVGGHVGFALRGKKHRWSEVRALEFLNQHR